MRDPNTSTNEPTTVDPVLWRELIARGDYWFRVVSDSMAPTLLPGDQVLVQPLAQPAVPGQVVVFVHEGKLVVHRCIGERQFRGDAKIVPDPPVPVGNIVGLAATCRRGDLEWPLVFSLPLATRWARCRLRCGRLDRWLRRFLKGTLNQPR